MKDSKSQKQIFTDSSSRGYHKVVLRHRREYSRRPALQAVYRHWSDRIRRHLSTAAGRSIELGCGCGTLSGHLGLTKTDLHKLDWVDEVVNACDMPYQTGEACNEAIPTLLFVRHQNELRRRWPQLAVIQLEFSDAMVYPLTGGFSRRSWLPASWVVPLMKFEDILLKKTGRLLAMRMLVVMEKKKTIE